MFNLLRITVLFICLILASSINIFAQQQEVQITAPKFQELDTNSDGFITPEEMSVYQAKQFEELDKDKSGSIDSDELKVDKTNMHNNADINKDGNITQS